jgi:hypothetical protein
MKTNNILVPVEICVMTRYWRPRPGDTRVLRAEDDNFTVWYVIQKLEILDRISVLFLKVPSYTGVNDLFSTSLLVGLRIVEDI